MIKEINKYFHHHTNPKHPPSSATKEPPKLAGYGIVDDNVVVIVDPHNPCLFLEGLGRRDVTIVGSCVCCSFKDVKKLGMWNVLSEMKDGNK